MQLFVDEESLGSRFTSINALMASPFDQTEGDILPAIRDNRDFSPSAENNVTGAALSSTEMIEEMPTPTPIVKLRRNQSSLRRFNVLQQFEGVVLEVFSDKFEAQLHDLTHPDNPEEFATFSVREISPSDLPLLMPGGVFYWILGYEVREGGQITRVSEIRLRRSALWSRREIEAIRAKSQETFNALCNDGKKEACQD